jgi:hypothetical protein
MCIVLILYGVAGASCPGYGGSYMFKVNPVSRATGYLFGFFKKAAWSGRITETSTSSRALSTVSIRGVGAPDGDHRTGAGHPGALAR